MSTPTSVPQGPTQAGGPRPRRRRWLFALIAALVIVALGAIGVFAWMQQMQSCVKASDPTRSGAISEYCPASPYEPFSGGGAMVSGPDGNLWYIDSQHKIARLTPQSGAVTDFAAPTAPNDVAYGGMVRGKDGNIWYVANYTLGRISMNGEFKEYALPKDSGFVGGIVAGTDGTLWVTMGSPDLTKPGALLQVTLPSDPSAAPRIAKVPLPSTTQMGPIAAAPDGSLWLSMFVTSGQNTSTHITRITPTGAITQLPVSISGAVSSLTAGPDGKMWYVSVPNHMGQITLAGAVTLFNVSEIGEMPGLPTLAVGSDNNAWFATKDSRIGRITPAGVVTTYSLPHSGGGISNITVGPEGGIWLLNGYSQPPSPTSRLVRITP